MRTNGLMPYTAPTQAICFLFAYSPLVRRWWGLGPSSSVRRIGTPLPSAMTPMGLKTAPWSELRTARSAMAQMPMDSGSRSRNLSERQAKTYMLSYMSFQQLEITPGLSTDQPEKLLLQSSIPLTCQWVTNSYSLAGMVWMVEA